MIFKTFVNQRTGWDSVVSD